MYDAPLVGSIHETSGPFSLPFCVQHSNKQRRFCSLNTASYCSWTCRATLTRRTPHGIWFRPIISVPRPSSREPPVNVDVVNTSSSLLFLSLYTPKDHSQNGRRTVFAGPRPGHLRPGAVYLRSSALSVRDHHPHRAHFSSPRRSSRACRPPPPTPTPSSPRHRLTRLSDAASPRSRSTSAHKRPRS